METLREFKSRIRKVNQPKEYKVRNSLGVYDAYKWIRKNKWLNIGGPLKEHEFYSIIRRINDLLAEELLKGNDVKLPKAMGSFDLRKYDTTPRIGKNGEVISNAPIDWNKTLELWYEDEESYSKRTLIRTESKEEYKFYYNKFSATYNNKSYYEFTFNKDLRQRLRQRVKEGKIIDAPYIKIRRYGTE